MQADEFEFIYVEVWLIHRTAIGYPFLKPVLWFAGDPSVIAVRAAAVVSRTSGSLILGAFNRKRLCETPVNAEPGRLSGIAYHSASCLV